jgi:hypothetical protein
MDTNWGLKASPILGRDNWIGVRCGTTEGRHMSATCRHVDMGRSIRVSPVVGLPGLDPV